jgi:hypothetical protein
MATKEKFFWEEVPQCLKQLTPDTSPDWGVLTPQAMIEHLVGSWRISNGKAQVERKTPKKELPKYRQFLYSDQPYEKNIKNPIMPENEPPPLRKPDLQSAKEQLLKEIDDFFDFFEQQPEATPVHPIFGALDKDGWLTFQYKHMRHHFKQFGILND